MAFSKEIKMKAFIRANGQCECRRNCCPHAGRCKKSCAEMSFINNYKVNVLGEEPVFPGFEFHHIVVESVGGKDTLSNCEFLCEECHKRTASYGRKG
ncbi:HNH endonuclease [Candidatus Saccharibacteria bacterium]|nr:HNH endonuclease [Candidatus Saccharibacteria bacterium]